MPYIRKVLLFAISIITSPIIFAQNKIAVPVEGAFMTSEGKIYVVMAVVLTILAGLFFFLVRLEIKMKKLEKEETTFNK